MRHNAIWSLEENAYRTMVAAHLYGLNKKLTDRATISPSPAEGEAIMARTLANEARKTPGLPLYVMDRIALIPITGTMVKGPDMWDYFMGSVADTALIHAAVETASASSDIDAIMLLVDSPGGSVDGIAQLADAVFAARKIKPITAQVDGMCASAAYYVASQTQSITANRMDMIGSIGTRILLYDYSEMFRMSGVKAIAVDTGEYKSAGAEGTPITDRQVADFQRIVDRYGADFLAGVRRGRRYSEEQIKGIADGRVWTAPEALGLGLIDGIKTNMQAIDEVRRGIKAGARASRARAQVALMGMGV